MNKRANYFSRLLLRVAGLSAVLALLLKLSAPTFAADPAPSEQTPAGTSQESTKPDKPTQTQTSEPQKNNSATAANTPTNAEKSIATDFLKLDVALQLTCKTEAFGVATAPPIQSKGEVVLELKLTDQTAGTGEWRVLSFSPEHKEAFASQLQQTKMCKSGCLLRQAPSDQNNFLELWAPKPMTVDKLGKKDRLTIIVIEKKTLSLKASMFEGPAPLGFEEGKCEAKT